MDKKYAIIGIIVTALVVGPLSFVAGKHSASKSPVAMGQQGQFQRQGGMGARTGNRTMMGGGGVSGEVIAKDDKSITVKLADGGSKIVFLSASTTVSKQATGSLTDVAVGSTVFVGGTPNSDGSVTAQSVQLRPAMPAVAPKQ